EPKSDEVGSGKTDAAKDKGEPGKEKAEPGKEKAPLKVDTEGLKDRIVQLPVQAAFYRNLQSAGSALYYLRQGRKDSKPALQMYDLAQQKETALGSVGGFEISADHKKMLVNKDASYAIIDLPKGPVNLSETLNLAGMEMKLNRHQEWRQIFNE